MANVKWSELPDDTPLEYEQENQKRPGSKSHDLYERYKKSKTYGEAKANGARPEDFRHDYGKGWLKLQPAGGQLPLVAPKNGAKKDEGSKRPSKDGGSKKSKEEDEPEPIWQDTRDPEQIQQDLKKQEQLSKELNELKNDQYKKRERPKDAFEMAMEAFSKGSSKSSQQIKVPEAAAALDVKLEKAHKQLQKETMEQLEKARKEKAEKARIEAEKAAREAREREAKVKLEKAEKADSRPRGAKAPEKPPEKGSRAEKAERKRDEKIEKAEKAEAKAEKKEKVEVKPEKPDKVKHEKSDKEKEKKLKKDKKEKKHKKDKKHKKHKDREDKKPEVQGAQGTKKTPRLSAARIRELLRSKVMGKDKDTKPKVRGGISCEKNEEGLYVYADTRKRKSQYVGVDPAFGASRYSWRARFDRNFLGHFETEEEAARAYAKARREYESSRKNGGIRVPQGNQSNGVKKAAALEEKEASPKSQEKIPDSLQETVELLQRQINELKPQQLDKLMEYFKAEITWRADDAEDFNFDLKSYSVPRLRELTRLIRQVRSEDTQAAQPDANERLRLQQARPASQSAHPLAAVHPRNERELQDKIRELEQKNQNQQRQIEEQKAQMMQLQQAQAQVHVQEQSGRIPVQDLRFAPGQNTFGGSSGSMRPNETWKVAQEAMAQAMQAGHAPSLHSLPPGCRWPAGYIGDGGGWVPGGEPPKNAQPPAVPPGDTEPPGRCVESCRCGQVVSRAWEVEKPWLKDEARAMAIMAAIHRFESQPSVERRGKVSKQNRYEPASTATQQALAAEVAGRVPLPAHMRMRAP